MLTLFSLNSLLDWPLTASPGTMWEAWLKAAMWSTGLDSSLKLFLNVGYAQIKLK